MHYYLKATRGSALAADGHLGDPFSTKIAKNRNENTVREKNATRALKSAQSAPKGLQNGAQISEIGSRSRSGGDFLPNGPTFIKPAQACTDCMCTPLGEFHFRTILPQK